MILDLKQVFEIPGEILPIETSLDFSDCELSGTHPFTSPAVVSGRIENEAGVVFLKYSVRFSFTICCDRCLDEFSRDYLFEFEEILVREESPENDEFIPVPEEKLDLNAQVFSDVLLSLPSKFLCSEDCKGLCPKCGTNWNHAACHCSTKEIDPRLAVLGELLK